MRRIVILAVIGGVLSLPQVATAHSWMVSANPAPAAVLRRAPERIVLDFSTPLERARSRVTLERAKGRSLALGGVAAGRPLSLELGPARLERGVYRVRYDAVGIDGHEVDGSYLFAIWPSGSPEPAGIDELSAASARAGSSGPSDAARSAGVIATVVVAGLLFTRLWSPTSWNERASRAVLLLSGAAIAADAAQIVVNGATTVVGRWTIAHAVLALGAGAVGAVKPFSRVPSAIATGLGASLVLPIAALGHRPGPVAVLTLWIHLVAAALWAGGVVAIVLGGRDKLVDGARRFTPVAAGSVVAIVLTGVITGRLEIPTLHSLFVTSYGRALLVKIVLVAVLIGLGAWSYLRSRRGVAPPARAELGAFAAVFVAASVLSSLPTPAPVRGPSLMPLVRTGVLADRVVNVLVAPYRPGRNTVQVWSDERGAPPRISVTLSGIDVHLDRHGTGTFTLPEGASELRLAATGGRWTIPLEARRSEVGRRVTTAISLKGAGADGCRDRLLGEMAAVASRPDTALDVVLDDRATCSQVATDELRDSGSAFARFFSARGVRHPVVLADSSPRSKAFVGGFGRHVRGMVVESVDAARRAGGDLLVLASGTADAKRIVDASRSSDVRTWPQRGIALAPWLLEPAILEPPSGRQPGPQLTLGLTVDPFSREATGYLQTLQRYWPSVRPTGTGLHGYLAARRKLGQPHPARTQAVQFFTPALWQILPSAVGGTHGGHLWLENGGLATISGHVPLGNGA